MVSKAENTAYKILLIEDSPEDRLIYKRYLSQDLEHTYQFEETELGQMGLELCQAHQPDLILLDYWLPDMEGLEFLKELLNRKENLPCPVIVLTGHGEVMLATECMKHGAQDYLIKGKINGENLRRSVEYSLLTYQRKIKESYFQHTAILESISDAFYSLDSQERFIYVNHKAEELWGKRREGLLGQKICDVFPKLPDLPSYPYLRRALTEQISVEFEVEAYYFQQWVEVRVFPASGGISVYFQNISARKKNEFALRESEERYRTLFNTMAQGVVYQDASGKIIKANPAAERVLGLTMSQMQGLTSVDPRWRAIHEDGSDFPGETHPGMVALSTGQVVENVVMGVYHYDKNDFVWINVNAVPQFRPGETTPYQVYATFDDITERVQAEKALLLTHQHTTEILESIDDAFYALDSEEHFIYINNKTEELWKMKREDLLGKKIWEVFPLMVGQTPYHKLQQALTEQISIEFEVFSKFTNMWTGIKIYPLSGGISVYIRDISERKRMEAEQERLHEQLSNEQARLLEVLRQMPVGVAIAEAPNANIILSNSALTQIWEQPIIHTEERHETVEQPYQPLESPMIRAISDGEVITNEQITFLRSDGTRGTLLVSAAPVHNNRGEIVVGVLSAIDITERIQAEEALRQSEEMYRMLARHLPDSAVLVFDRELRYVMAEGGALSRNGYSPELLEGKTLQEVNQPEEVARLLPYYQAALAGLENTFEEYRENLIFLVKAVPIKDKRGSVVGGMLFSQDITSLKQAEQYLSNEKERLSVTLRSIGDGVITTNLEGQVTLLNRVAENLTGWTQAEATGRPLTEIFQLLYEGTLEPQEGPLQETLKTGQVLALRNHTLLVARDGTRYSIADSCAPIRNRDGNIIGAVLVFRDVTAELKLKEELQKTAKLESLGIFAGGLAHDFNNLLSGIIGYLDLLRLAIHDPEKTEVVEVDDYIKQALGAATRAKDLTLQLLTFSKGGAPVKKIVELPTLIGESARFVLHGTPVEPVFKLPEKLATVEVDPGQLSQVIQNLVLNATQAMPEGGIITITAQNVRLQNEASLPLPDGNYVLIKVIDQGVGITPENLDRIFDPFFTTKVKGSGLGLAVCYSIIQQHNGYIKVESQVGQGTVFYLYLPAATHKSVSNHPKDNLTSDISTPNIKPLKILVMDDEYFLRNMLKKLLLKLGHVVEVAAEGEEAYRLYQAALEAGERFDVVLLDLTVPGGLGGQQTFIKLREIDPAVTAVVCSGYSRDPIMSNFQEFGYKAVLPKPYQINELKHVLAQVME